MQTAEEVYHVYFDEASRTVVMEWRGYATSKQFRAGTELMLRTLIENKAVKVLADIENMAIIGRDDQHWLENNFLPRAIQQGFRAVAMVTPRSYFNKVAVESVSYKIDRDKLAIHFFTSREEAENYLRTGF